MGHGRICPYSLAASDPAHFFWCSPNVRSRSCGSQNQMEPKRGSQSSLNNSSNRGRRQGTHTWHLTQGLPLGAPEDAGVTGCLCFAIVFRNLERIVVYNGIMRRRCLLSSATVNQRAREKFLLFSSERVCVREAGKWAHPGAAEATSKNTGNEGSGRKAGLQQVRRRRRSCCSAGGTEKPCYRP
jgi:hypothetical protein